MRVSGWAEGSTTAFFFFRARRKELDARELRKNSDSFSFLCVVTNKQLFTAIKTVTFDNQSCAFRMISSRRLERV